ncbi:MAG: endonuclease/exonuclease/phosphatase family protein [Fimbriimonadaceae bacterium]|nr:endonuclease/exonuclease/phosphatase family protein [Fimbriimonadaceae bacterium]
MESEPPKKRNPILSILAKIYLITVLLSPYTPSNNIFHSLFNYAPPVVLCAPLVPVLAVLFYKICRKRNLRTDPFLAAAILISMPIIFTYEIPHSQNSTNGHWVRVVTHNVNFESREVPELRNYIIENKIDVVYLQEVKGGEESPASYLQKNLPGWHMVTERETAILSRFELSDVRSTPLGSLPQRVVLSARVNAPTPFRAMTCHWSVPQFRKKLLRANFPDQHADFETTVQAIQESELPVILGGDFNCTPRHGLMRQLSSQLQNAFTLVGAGPGLTFNSKYKLVRIDHLLSSKGIRPVKCVVESALGSDHHALFAEFALENE